jgi:NOL1/NOP2/sun family putative RNA methylase
MMRGAISGMLPTAFITQMRQMLGDQQLAQFLKCYDEPRTYGLRFNRLKMNSQLVEHPFIQQAWDLERIPWCKEGYYYDHQQRPGKHPFHAAGLYYIQEPSAMTAAELLDPQPGETILDLAAAPGGKSTQIAAKMQGSGVLISNEIHPARAKILSENIERMGIVNVIVTCAAPNELAARFPATFDRIMLDAPCSGEGMFRKDEGAIKEWSPESVQQCAARQWGIIQDAISMLKRGGMLAYSTCTFNRQENEEMVQRILVHYPDMMLIKEHRVWPHLQQGEGHYVALLQNGQLLEHEGSAHLNTSKGSTFSNNKDKTKDKHNKELSTAWDAYSAWAKEVIPHFHLPQGRPILFGENLYFLPTTNDLSLTSKQLNKLKLPRAGLQLGEYRKSRFIPAHALAMAVKVCEASQVHSLVLGASQVTSYLHGETISVDDKLTGWCIVAIAFSDHDAFPLGWGKASQGQLKNHLPKGLRQQHA